MDADQGVVAGGDQGFRSPSRRQLLSRIKEVDPGAVELRLRQGAEQGADPDPQRFLQDGAEEREAEEGEELESGACGDVDVAKMCRNGVRQIWVAVCLCSCVPG